MTPIDRAHITAEETGEEADRRAFWTRLAEAELHLLLAAPSDGETAMPRLFEIDGTSYALAFDLPERLSAFAGVAPTASLSGRRLATMLAAQGLGLGLNLDDAPSAQLLPPDAMAWLTETLATDPEEAEGRFTEIGPPGALPEALLTAIDGKLPLMAGLASGAYLAQVTAESGVRSHILAFLDPVPGAEPALARAIAEALALSGLEAAQLDVTFLRASQTRAATFARHGLHISLPASEAQASPERPGQGGPPRLR
ncbi:MAG: SseB family protein [Pseudomonadota bacterium]